MKISKTALATLESSKKSAVARASKWKSIAEEAPATAGLTQFISTVGTGFLAGKANAKMDDFMGAEPSLVMGLMGTGGALAAYLADLPGLNLLLGFAAGNLAVSAANFSEDQEASADTKSESSTEPS